MWQYIYTAHTCTSIQVCCSWGYDGLNWHSRHRTVLKCNTKIVKKKIMIFWFLPKTSSQLWSFNVSKCSRWSMLKTHFVSHSLSIHCVLHKSKLLQQKKFIGSQLAMVCSCVLHVLYNRVHVSIVPSLYLFGDLMTRCGAVF